MILLYNWERILRHAGTSSQRVNTIFRAMMMERPPYSRKDPRFKYCCIDFQGLSFLSDPHRLLANMYKYRPLEIANYIGLASFRNLGEYKATGKITLDLPCSPLGEAAIIKNRLLRVENNQIHFLLEDYTKEK